MESAVHSQLLGAYLTAVSDTLVSDSAGAPKQENKDGRVRVLFSRELGRLSLRELCATD